MIYDQPQGVREGPLVRADYLEETGMEEPVTTEDWMNVFEKMKNNGVQYPMGVSNSGRYSAVASSANAFGTSGGHAFKVDSRPTNWYTTALPIELRDFVESSREHSRPVYQPRLCLCPDV